MSHQNKALRALISGEDLIVIPECLSAISARVIEETGFAVTYCGGNALGTFHHAIPDYGLLAPAELAGHVARITASVSIPVVVDADQGGETVANVLRTVRIFEHSGAAGLHIEDSVNPKHSRLPSPLVPIAEMQQRIATAVDARLDSDFVIIARCEGLFNKKIYETPEPSIEEVIERGLAYAEAGADVYMPITMSPEEIPLVAAEVPIPLFDINHAVASVKDTPLKGNIFSGWAGPAAVRAHAEWASFLYDRGDIPPEVFAFDERAGLIRQPDYDSALEAWAKRMEKPVLEADRPLGGGYSI